MQTHIRLDSFYADAAASTGYVAPTLTMLAAAEQRPVGRSDAVRSYYLYVAIH